METKSPFVVICTPSLSKSFCVEYQMSWMATQSLLTRSGIDHVWRSQGGDPYLDKVRNRLASEALTRFPEATDIFFIDDDEGWPAEKVLEFINRPEDVLVGVYPKKKDETEFPCQLLLDEKGDFIERDGLYEVALGPTGFMRIKRHVLEKMAAGSLIYPDPDAQGNLVDIWNIFQTGVTPDPKDPKRGIWWGEDYFFCARWRQMGGTVWCDPNVLFTHRGQKVWAANFLDSIKLTEKAKALAGAKSEGTA